MSNSSEKEKSPVAIIKSDPLIALDTVGKSFSTADQDEIINRAVKHFRRGFPRNDAYLIASGELKDFCCLKALRTIQSSRDAFTNRSFDFSKCGDYATALSGIILYEIIDSVINGRAIMPNFAEVYMPKRICVCCGNTRGELIESQLGYHHAECTSTYSALHQSVYALRAEIDSFPVDNMPRNDEWKYKNAAPTLVEVKSNPETKGEKESYLSNIF